MKFRIIGADEEFGNDVQIILEATDANTARTKANRMGILVAECYEVQDSPSDTSAPKSLSLSDGERHKSYVPLLEAANRLKTSAGTLNDCA